MGFSPCGDLVSMAYEHPAAKAELQRDVHVGTTKVVP